MNCLVCKKDIIGRGVTCSVKCRVAKSRMNVKPLETSKMEEAVSKKDNACLCGVVGEKDCMKKNKSQPCKECPHAFFICGRHGEHIEKYCQVMCNDER